MIPVRRSIAFVIFVALSLLFWAAPAAAHTGFESSNPRDGESMDAPIQEVTLVFTGTAEPTGVGFEVLDPDGKIRKPADQSSPDGSTWVLRFEPPLAGGTVGLRWMVKAPDAHPIDGSFTFTVPTAAVAPVGAVAESLTPEPEGRGDDPGTDLAALEPSGLEQFLSAGEGATDGAELVGTAGRIAGLAGAVIGVGALVFAATVLRGTHGDVRCVLLWVRRAGVMVMVGALVEAVAQLGVDAGGEWSLALRPSTVSSVLWGSFGVAIGLRLFGGRLLLALSRIHVAGAMDGPDPVVAIRELVSVAGRELVGANAPGHGPSPGNGATGGAGASSTIRGTEPFVHADDQAWVPTAGSVGPFLGVAAIVGSYVFDGHTVTKGDRGLTGLLNLVHVGAGAVWVGGVAMLVVVLWRRRREGRELRSLQLAVRFSVIASIAVAAVGAAGVALAFTILNGPGELWSTPWGRLLLAKTALVGVAAAMGAYNHKVLIPQMSEHADNLPLAHQFKRAVTTEALILGMVVVSTAFLVGAGS